METKFNFNSQICTTREQSERLLALGLKQETADMKYLGTREYYGCVLTEGMSSVPMIIDTEDDDVTEYDIPAWSLGRLIEIKVMKNSSQILLPLDNTFNGLIEDIETRIKEGYFNKEYFV